MRRVVEYDFKRVSLREITDIIMDLELIYSVEPNLFLAGNRMLDDEDARSKARMAPIRAVKLLNMLKVVIAGGGTLVVDDVVGDKQCPLLTLGSMIAGQIVKVPSVCVRHKCAWWNIVDRQCVLLSVMDHLNDVVRNMELEDGKW